MICYSHRMYSFRNDYSDGGHPEILKVIRETAGAYTEGYGEDRFCREAALLLREKIGDANADIHFISGGTLTNLLTLQAMLRPHEAVLSAETGHIYVHETGAVEATGHKVIPLESRDGKISPGQIRVAVDEHHFEHMVKPKVVYISQSTENGTLYSQDEIYGLRAVCDELSLYLYVDGARLGSALSSDANDLSLKDLADSSDAFYIGGTKNGALFGEALILCNDRFKDEFRYLMKQRGAIMAKGRFLGLQFLALFKDDLFFRLGTHSNRMAAKLQEGIEGAGFEMQFHSHTNQIFPVLPESLVEELEKKFLFYRWGEPEKGMVTIRLVCSWATEERSVDLFINTLR